MKRDGGPNPHGGSFLFSAIALAGALLVLDGCGQPLVNPGLRALYPQQRMILFVDPPPGAFVPAPCWNTFDCPLREKCPAYQIPGRPCYDVREYRDTLCNGPCERCAIYLNRDVKKQKTLEQHPPLD